MVIFWIGHSSLGGGGVGGRFRDQHVPVGTSLHHGTAAYHLLYIKGQSRCAMDNTVAGKPEFSNFNNILQPLRKYAQEMVTMKHLRKIQNAWAE